jgi:hypothetical protein
MVLDVEALNVKAFPVQTGLLEDAEGVDGVSFMIAVTPAACEVHPFMVTVTL